MPSWGPGWCPRPPHPRATARMDSGQARFPRQSGSTRGCLGNPQQTAGPTCGKRSARRNVLGNRNKTAKTGNAPVHGRRPVAPRLGASPAAPGPPRARTAGPAAARHRKHKCLVTSKGEDRASAKIYALKRVFLGCRRLIRRDDAGARRAGRAQTRPGRDVRRCTMGGTCADARRAGRAPTRPGRDVRRRVLSATSARVDAAAGRLPLSGRPSSPSRRRLPRLVRSPDAGPRPSVRLPVWGAFTELAVRPRGHGRWPRWHVSENTMAKSGKMGKVAL